MAVWFAACTLAGCSQVGDLRRTQSRRPPRVAVLEGPGRFGTDTRERDGSEPHDASTTSTREAGITDGSLLFDASDANGTPDGEAQGDGSVGDAAIAMGDLTPLGTVFVILMENKDWSQIAGNLESAPYLNQLIEEGSAYCTGYLNVLGTALHPSEPNYISLEAGDTLGLTTNALPGPDNCAKGADHLTAQLDAKAISWRSYQEGITGVGCPLVNTAEKYVARHNPVVFFEDVSGPDCADASSLVCEQHVRPYGELALALANDQVSRYNFITPNLCNDMHDACGGDAIRHGDNWLKAAVSAIQDSAAYKRDGVIFITWDEGKTPYNNPIGMLAISRFARAGAVDCTGLSHASLLHTLQTIFDVGPYLGNAATEGEPGLSRLFVSHP